MIESFLDCKYKSFLLQKGQCGVKKDFENMKVDIKKNITQNIQKRLIEVYEEQNVLKEFKFGSVVNGKYQKLAIPLLIEDEKYSLVIDGLELHFGKKALRNGRYIPLLFSEKEKVSKKEKLILTIQSIFFAKITGFNIISARIYYGKEMKTLKFNIARFIPESLRIINDIEKIVSGKFEPAMCKKDHCKICEYEEECILKLVEKDDLSLLSCIGEKELIQYGKKGIFSLKQLSYTFKPRKRNKKSMNNQNPYYSSLQALAIREKKVYVYDEISLPLCKTKVYLDFEGNSEGSFVYLIGILVEQDNEQSKYSLWANSKDEEQSIFEELIKILLGLEQPHIFYYGKYDWKIFKHIISKKINQKIKEILLNNSTDTLAKIRRNIYFPTYSNGLKEIGKFLGCIWSDPQSSGLQTIVWRYKWEKSKEESLKNKLITYNQEDCIALKQVADFLYEITGVTNSTKLDCKLPKIQVVEEMKSNDNKYHFQRMEFSSKDIEIITKYGYFEYQKNKIFWRTDRNIRKAIIRERKQHSHSQKINKVIFFNPQICQQCGNKSVTAIDRNRYRITHFDLQVTKYGIKKWITEYRTSSFYCKLCKVRFIPEDFKWIPIYWTREILSRTIKKSSDSVFENNIDDKPSLIIPIMCPVCNSEDVVRNGLWNGAQSYRCNACSKPFSETCRSIKSSYISGSSDVNAVSRSPNIWTRLRRHQKTYGHNLLTWVIHQRIVNNMTTRNIYGNLTYYFKIFLENGMIDSMMYTAASYYQPTYNTILNKLVDGSFLHVDESQIKLMNTDGYIWVFTNFEEVYYIYRQNRESDFLHNFLSGFDGILISDFYSGYDSLDCSQQKCLIHLIRDLNDALLKNLYDDELKKLVSEFGKLLRNIVETIDKYGLKKRHMKKHQKEVIRFFNNLKKTKFQSELVEKLQKRLLRYEDKLFVFLNHDNIPWNNNYAEQAIKSLKHQIRPRKGRFTETSLNAYLTLFSIYQSCRRKGINFIDFLLSKEKDIDKFQSSSKR